MAFASKSPWLIHYDAASCNGCDIEVLACLTPLYDVERFGVINTGNPRHADILVVTGSVNEQCEPVIKQIYDQMVEPKVVVAIGICACSGGIFHDCYNVKGGVDKVIPVDVYVPGCSARPQAIIDGVVKAIGILDQKREAMAAGVPLPQGHLDTGEPPRRVPVKSPQQLAAEAPEAPEAAFVEVAPDAAPAAPAQPAQPAQPVATKATVVDYPTSQFEAIVDAMDAEASKEVR